MVVGLCGSDRTRCVARPNIRVADDRIDANHESQRRHPMMKRLAAVLALATMIAIAACSSTPTTAPTLPTVTTPTTSPSAT